MAGYIKKFQVKCDHELQFDWPSGTILVPHIRKDGFNFEIYSQDPDSYFTGWGDNFKEAEEKGWKKFQGYKNCDAHDFERRGYTNGVGFCKKCNLFKTNAFPPAFNCEICGIPTNYSYDDDKKYFCQKHESHNKGKDYAESKLFKERMNRLSYSKEEFNEALKKTIEHIITII